MEILKQNVVGMKTAAPLYHIYIHSQKLTAKYSQTLKSPFNHGDFGVHVSFRGCKINDNRICGLEPILVLGLVFLGSPPKSELESNMFLAESPQIHLFFLTKMKVLLLKHL